MCRCFLEISTIWKDGFEILGSMQPFSLFSPEISAEQNAEHVEITSGVNYSYLASSVLKFNVHPFVTLKCDLYMPEKTERQQGCQILCFIIFSSSPFMFWGCLLSSLSAYFSNYSALFFDQDVMEGIMPWGSFPISKMSRSLGENLSEFEQVGLSFGSHKGCVEETGFPPQLWNSLIDKTLGHDRPAVGIYFHVFNLWGF